MLPPYEKSLRLKLVLNFRVLPQPKMLASDSPTIVRPSPWMAPSTLIVQLSRVHMTILTRVESSESGIRVISTSEM